MFNQCGFIFQNPEGVTLYQIEHLFNHYPDTTLYAFMADCPVVPPVVVTDSVSQVGTNTVRETHHGLGGGLAVPAVQLSHAPDRLRRGGERLQHPRPIRQHQRV